MREASFELSSRWVEGFGVSKGSATNDGDGNDNNGDGDDDDDVSSVSVSVSTAPGVLLPSASISAPTAPVPATQVQHGQQQQAFAHRGPEQKQGSGGVGLSGLALRIIRATTGARSSPKQGKLSKSKRKSVRSTGPLQDTSLAARELASPLAPSVKCKEAAARRRHKQKKRRPSAATTQNSEDTSASPSAAPELA